MLLCSCLLRAVRPLLGAQCTRVGHLHLIVTQSLRFRRHSFHLGFLCDKMSLDLRCVFFFFKLTCVFCPPFQQSWQFCFQPDFISSLSLSRFNSIICGLTQFTNRSHLAFAALEAVCFQTREVSQTWFTNRSHLGLRCSGCLFSENMAFHSDSNHRSQTADSAVNLI